MIDAISNTLVGRTIILSLALVGAILFFLGKEKRSKALKQIKADWEIFIRLPSVIWVMAIGLIVILVVVTTIFHQGPNTNP